MNIDPVTFIDKDSGDEGFVQVRVVGSVVGLALSLKQDGDLEVLFGAPELDRIINALEMARRAIEASE
ncbi:MAG: hypothetical protein WA418_31685 [Bradyrhizobium sp.]